MNARLEAKLSMIRATQELVADSSAIITSTGLAAMTTLNGNIETIIDEIVSTMSDTEASTADITALKAEARFAMIEAGASIAGKAYAYAIVNNDTALAAQVGPWKTKSALIIQKDNVVNAICQNIHDYVAAVDPQSSLVAYGIIADVVGPPAVDGTLTIFQDLITAYELIVATPEAAIEARKAKNVLLKDLFTLADTNLGSMDSLMYNLQFEDPASAPYEFYTEFKAARTIFDPVTTHTKIKGKVIDITTSMPIEGAKVTVLPTGTGLDPIIVFSDVNGDYSAYTPKFKANPYIVKAEKTGYGADQIGDIFVKLGKPTTVNFNLIPVTP